MNNTLWLKNSKAMFRLVNAYPKLTLAQTKPSYKFYLQFLDITSKKHKVIDNQTKSFHKMQINLKYNILDLVQN